VYDSDKVKLNEALQGIWFSFFPQYFTMAMLDGQRQWDMYVFVIRFYL
jgi:hypothetical protein